MRTDYESELANKKEIAQINLVLIYMSFAKDTLNVLKVLPKTKLPCSLRHPAQKSCRHRQRVAGVGRLLLAIFGLLVILHSTRAEYDDYGFESRNILMPSSAAQ